MDALLTRFDNDNPCWTEKLLQMAGEDTTRLRELARQGLLHLDGGAYALTDAGAEAFEAAARELFLEEKPGRASDAPEADVFRTALRLCLDNAHVQRWGIKDFKVRAVLPFLPNIAPDDMFTLHGDRLEWNYPNLPAYRKMTEDFPIVTIDARDTGLVPRETAERWARGNGAAFGTLETDLLYLYRYDFMQYKEFGGHPNDPLRLINADRFLFVIPGDTPGKNLVTIGKFHLWLNYLRRMQIPGYVDRDTQEQDSVSWLVFATETETEAKRLVKTLAPCGEALVKNTNPCEIWTISLEALENVDQKRELIWELLPEIAHPIQRTLI